MSDEYERTFERTRAVLTQEHIEALGPSGVQLLYDAVMIMAFADGEIVDAEARFLNDLSEYIGTSGSDDDLTPEGLLARLSELTVDPRASEAMLKVLLIVSDLDGDVDADELALWRDVGDTLGITQARMETIRKLLQETHEAP